MGMASAVEVQKVVPLVPRQKKKREERPLLHQTMPPELPPLQESNQPALSPSPLACDFYPKHFCTDNTGRLDANRAFVAQESTARLINKDPHQKKLEMFSCIPVGIDLALRERQASG